jgi:hypothetical protein
MAAGFSSIDGFGHLDEPCTVEEIQKARWGAEEFCRHYPEHETRPHLVKSQSSGQIS